MIPEQSALLAKSRESLKAARLLAEGGYFDFAVSRAYYAMFYVVEALLLEEGLAFSKHSAVIAAFGQKFAKTGCVPQDFHRYLIEAEHSRNVGDYDIGADLTEEDARKHIDRAEEFLKVGEQLIAPE
ncbi:MAG: HEPN domain-containing protein [Candidatus Abyssobacteria bacterium SURF_17]|uniref:HEPN domain-containing protein n=1 Tax=Candidatus Abyssobacteria bacterium SURF_17 TaxID=2093361 RepID=A0A419EV80_9BACT|nr:MAG: HEPN domain-containing protein [Candidatus Abyssubacteria bacterium SURF_17]